MQLSNTIVQSQTILQYFYKLLIWQILTSNNLAKIIFLLTINYLKNTKVILKICKNILK